MRGITVDELLAMVRWIEKGASEEERETRLARVREQLFPAGLDELERTRREALVAAAELRAKETENDADPMPLPGAAPPPPPPERKPSSAYEKWKKSLPEAGRARRWANDHDGLDDEVKRMQAESVGSPFEVGRLPEPLTPSPTRTKK